MNYWIFTVTEHRVDGGRLSAKEIFRTRVADKFWGLGEKTPNRKLLAKGDKVIFYVGIPDKIFAGIATIASKVITLSDKQKNELGHGIEFYKPDYGVFLDEIDVWVLPPSAKELAPHLQFIENKEYWGSYLQGGVRQLSEDDFKTILSRQAVPGYLQIAEAEIESQSDFALESHLEEFLYKNWTRVNWGSDLILIETEEQTGRQFPAGSWSIDFLTKDRRTDDLVIIELKKGRTSDSVVGQILRYISWVKENIAEPEQNVKGIIIAKEIDDALKYSVMNQPNLKVLTYHVTFSLNAAEN